ncbi:MAG: GNAT family N-acetyltransferase, partial [Thermoleophilaceae bacterium]
AMQIRKLRRDELEEGARIMTAAFVDDPAWIAIGPDRRRHRRAVIHLYHRAVLRITWRYGSPIFGAYAATGELAAIATTWPVGTYPPPQATFAAYVPAFVLAGPAPSVRGLRTSVIQEHGHPDEPHLYLGFLCVDPPRQRGGFGRALLARVYESAEGAPVYLDTANPANLPYYASNGFELIGEAALPRGARMWFLERR